jgi:hypothetical protein
VRILLHAGGHVLAVGSGYAFCPLQSQPFSFLNLEEGKAEGSGIVAKADFVGLLC